MLIRLALMLAALFWAGNFAVGKSIAGEITPVMLNYLRWFTALVFLLLFTLARIRTVLQVIRKHPGWFVVMGLCGVVYHILVYSALHYTTVTNMALIIGATPATILIITALMDGDRHSRLRVFSVALSFAGVAVLLGGDLGEPNYGDLVACAAMVMWAYYNVSLRRSPLEVDGLVLTTAITLAGVVIMLPLAGVQIALESVRFTGTIVLAILYVGIFASGIAFLLWNRGVMEIGPVKAGYFMNLVPVFGVMLGTVLLQETFTARQALAAIAIVSSLLLSEFYGRVEAGTVAAPGQGD